MAKEMLINVAEGEECRIALLDDGKLEELYMERSSSTSHVGNIYKGKVTNVEASIQAAFVDFGLGRNGFLHISDLMPTYFGRKGEDIVETVGKKMARRDRPPIQRCLRRGDEIVVQIIKEGIGTKGPTLSTYLSIPGRILVMMPGMASKGVSRKIEDDEERRRLRQILEALEPPEDCGFIIRTAGVGKSKAEIERDLKYLARLWETLKKHRDSRPAPVELYTEGDLVTRTVRDLFTADVDRIVIDSPEVAKRVKEVIKLTSPRTKNRVDVYEEPIPLFHKYNIEREIELMYSRHVPLPSGGSLVIDSTEAIVAIDVNSGKFRDHSDAEMTAFKTDLEAADEIARQLRLRDLGGVIICDFIDLRYERHRRELEQRLHDHLKKDRAKTKMLRMSQFGIIEMTRQRMRPSFKRSVYFDCPHCKGAGLVKTPESMSLDVMRRLAIAIHDQRVERIELAVCPDVAFYLQNKKRRSLAALENQTDKRIVVRGEPSLGLDEMRLELFDARDGLVVLEGLTTGLDGPPHRTQLSTKPQQMHGARGGRFDGRRQSAEQRRPPGARGGDRGRGGRNFAEEEMADADERLEMTEAGFGDDDDRGGHDDAADASDNGAVAAQARHQDRGDRGDRDRDNRDRDNRGAENRGGDRPRGDRNDQGRHDQGRHDQGRHDQSRRDQGGRHEQGARHPQGGRNDQGDRRDRGDNRDRDNRERDRGDRAFADQRDRGHDRGDSRGNDRGGQRDPQQRDQQRDPQRDPRRDPQHAHAPRDAGALPLEGRGPRGDEGDAGNGGNGGEEGGRRRRRRRRGRRGRGRGRHGENGAPVGAQGDARPFPSDAGDDVRDEVGSAQDHPEADWVHGDNDDDRDDASADPTRASADRNDDRSRGERPDAHDEPHDYFGDRHEDRRDEGQGERRDERRDERDEADRHAAQAEARPAAAPSGDVDDVRPEDVAVEPAPEPAAEAPQAAEEPAEAPAGRTGRRRGSRGGAGRGKKAAAEKAPAAAKAEAAAAEEAAPAKRRTRGGKAAGTAKATGAAKAGGTRSRGRKKPAAESEADAAAPASEPAPAASAPAASRRTGSTDRHVLSNEIEETPVMHEPVRRPRSPRDLDHIPEDFD